MDHSEDCMHTPMIIIMISKTWKVKSTHMIIPTPIVDYIYDQNDQNDDENEEENGTDHNY